MTIPLLRAAFRPASLDREGRTFEAVISTGAEVARRDSRGPFRERLDLSSLDPATLAGLPLLDAHRRDSTRDAIGVLDSARMEGGALVARIRVARGAEGDAVLDKVEDGVIRGVSIGYRPAKTVESRAEDGARIVTVTPEIAEISLVPIPADPGATIRSEALEDDEIETLERETTARAAANREIRSIAALSGLNRAWADEQIDAGATPDAARAAAFEALRTRAPAAIRAAAPADAGPGAIIERIGEALHARANPGVTPSEAARPHMGETLTDIARGCLVRSGAPVTGLSAGELATRALHTTSDFALILGDAVGRTLRQAYRAAPSGLKGAARQTTARDFRAKHSIQLSEAPTLEPISESGEFKRGTMAEAQESYRLETFGRIVGLSRQAIVNDDLGAFASLTGRIGAAAAAFEAAELVKLLEANGAMSDGVALFHASHGNLSAGGLLGESGISDARLAMRKQTGLSGDRIDVTPKWLIVPPDLETQAERELSVVQAAKTSDVNPFSSLGLIVEPRLSDPSTWYLVADPATVDGLEFAYLEGAPGPQIETRTGFDVDGLEIKVRLDFGAGFVDWRGWHRSTFA